MKIGLIVSAVIVLLFAGVLFLSTRGTPDPPTRATAPEKLVAVTLGDDLPAVFTPTQPDADAGALYDEAVLYARMNEEAMDAPQPLESVLTPPRDLLVKAMQAGRVSHGFLDKNVPVAITDAPDSGAALETLYASMVKLMDRQHEAGSITDAKQTALALWALGQRGFQHNDMLYARNLGLSMMEAAGSRLYDWSENDAQMQEAVTQWGHAINRVRSAWNDKLEIVASTKPHVGDLVNVAMNDQDKTFRIAGTLRLGAARFDPGTRANLGKINEAIEKAKADPDPRIREAALAAEALTVEEVRKLR